MIGRLITLQFTTWRRDKRLLGLLAAMGAATVAASLWTTSADVAWRHAQEEAATTARTQWVERDADHPHSRAHYGDFVFRPAGSLARLDQGVQAQLGKVLRIEAHRQGVPLHSDAARAGTIARFARPDAAFLLQTVVPLLLIFLGATGLAADRDSGRLKLSLVQGASARTVAAGHVLALWGLGLALLALVVLTSIGTSLVLEGSTTLDWGRLGGFVLAHSLFLGMVASGVVAASLWARSARSALLTLLALWVLGSALLPRAASSLATALYPLPSQDAFQAAMDAARADGPDGHNPEDAAVEKRKQEVLAQYGVESTKDLPIDFGGIAMQMDEEFGNQVWDEHYGTLRARFADQGKVMALSAAVNPFQAVDQVSMSLTGTDLAHDLDFQMQAETFRRGLVEALNNEHAYGGPKTRGERWEASPEFYEGLAAFSYTPPNWRQAIAQQAPEWIALFLWSALMWLALLIGAKRVDNGRSPC